MCNQLKRTIQLFVVDNLNLSSINNINSVIMLTDGKSDAVVYRIHVISRRRRDSGYYIIKIIEINTPWYNRSENEGNKGKEVYSTAGAFQNHITKVVCSGEVDGKLIVIYKQANDSVLNSISLEKLAISKAAPVLKTISYDLLKTWNSGYRVERSEGSFFRSILSYRIEQGGSFEERIGKFLENKDVKAFTFRNHIYPNPYYYIHNISSWYEKLPLQTVLKGNTHGDFHRKNIIISERGEKENIDYSIIDFDSFNKDSFLFFDHAYLETSIMYETTMNLSTDIWMGTVEKMIKTDIFAKVEEYLDHPIYIFRNAICDGIQKWVSEEGQKNMMDICYIQMYMARIAAGINYFCKKVISDEPHQIRLLLYSAICFKKLFEIIAFSEDYSDNLCTLVSSEGNVDYSQAFESKWIQYLSSYYIPVLLTDDRYAKEDYKYLGGLRKIKWSLVIDIGNKKAPNDFSTTVTQICSRNRKIEFYNLHSDIDRSITYIPETCLWLQAKKDDSTYLKLWRNYKAAIKGAMSQIYTSHGLKSLIFLFDVSDGRKFAWSMILDLMEQEEQLSGARIVELRTKTADRETIQALEELDIRYDVIKGATLIDAAKIADVEINVDDNYNLDLGIYLPGGQEIGQIFITKEELCFYETSIEIIYPGIEGSSESWDFGEYFYKGGEIQWEDLANDCDLPLLKDYEKYRSKLLRIVEKETPRVKTLKLIHDPGAGGTTLGKRLLWDLKERIPCVRLKKYSQETKNILLALYRKTNRRVLVLIEPGPNTITNDQIDELCYSINEQNGRILILITERKLRSVDSESIDINNESSNVIINLPERIKDIEIANRFLNKFSDKTNDHDRQEILRRITNERSGSPWNEQRTPFFYGFYTFQEEYNLEHFLLEENIDSGYEKDLLVDLALLTLYSQNANISYAELYRRKGIDYLSISISRLYEGHSKSVRSLIVEKEEGWRICHPLIAQLILKKLFRCDVWKDCIYETAIHFIERLQKLYGSDSEYANNVLRELFIDRSEFSTERASFSQLINDVERTIHKKELFQKLIDCFPNNPYYYSHKARLLADKSIASAPDYDKAIELLEKALEIAREEKLPEASHYVTLGSVYGRKIADFINNEKDNRNKGKLSIKSMSSLIDEIKDMYSCAENAFSSARRSANRIDSYYYYPYISLEITVLVRLFEFSDRDYTLAQLYDNDQAFKNWYDIHYSKAVRLFEEMQENTENVDINYKKYLEIARDKIMSISIRDKDWITGKLKYWAQKEGREASIHRRLLVAAIYTNFGFNWSKIDNTTLHLLADSMNNNILLAAGSDKEEGDIYRWYSIVRYLDGFDTSKVIELFEEHLGESYRKEYILYQMYFLRLTKGLASVQDVIKHINKCKGLLPIGVNDITNRDVYYQTNGRTCSPITPIIKVKKDDYIQNDCLTEFTGRITSVSGTSHGKIEMDDYNISITFNPVFTDDSGNRIQFQVEDEQLPVKFNLMFSYSGLRAWNVRKIDS